MLASAVEDLRQGREDWKKRPVGSRINRIGRVVIMEINLAQIFICKRESSGIVRLMKVEMR